MQTNLPPSLTIFTNPAITCRLSLRLFARLFARFTEVLPGKYCLPNPCPGNDCYFDSLAETLRRPGNQLPDCLFQALEQIETLAAPPGPNGRQSLVNPRLDREAPERLRQAIETWLASHPQVPASPVQPLAAPSAAADPMPNDAPGRPPSPPSQPSVVPEPTPQCPDPSAAPPSAGAQPATCNPPPPPTPTEADVFARLARLALADYDRVRLAQARRLRVRVQTLDLQVARLRAELDLQAQANAVHLPVLDPWPEPVDGATLLTQVASRFALYLVLPPGAPEALALWTAHTHALSAFHLSPRLNLCSPHAGCGKTTALDLLATLTPRPLRTENLSAAVLFRLVHQLQPTLLLDEVDAYLPQSEELRGLLNAGHKRGACAYRCEGERNAVRAFNAFSPAVLAGIGSLPATLRDRSILIPLAAALPGQLSARFDPLHLDREQTLARQLARWAADSSPALAASNPPLPPTAFNRLADNWRPLFAIAHLAGGDWPRLALHSFAKLATTPPRDPDDLRALLLADIRTVFLQSGASRLFSTCLIDSLCALPDRPWSQGSNGRPPVNGRWLARFLHPLGIHPSNLRLDGSRAKGYRLTDFTPAFERFLKTHSPL